jgi:dipeptidyl aminopeptidase/acylaminoacyl peptidase
MDMWILLTRTDLLRVLVVMILAGGSGFPAASQDSHPFNVQDDIELAHFGYVEQSPNGKWLAVQTERAALASDALRETVRIYSLDHIARALNTGELSKVEPEWSFDKVVTAQGSGSAGLSRLEWLSDSSGVAFLLRRNSYQHTLCFADLKTRQVQILSGGKQDIMGFDIRDATHYVFAAASDDARQRLFDQEKTSFRVGTGLDIGELAYPHDISEHIQRSDLWAANGGPARRVKDEATNNVVELFSDGNDSLALSPDGKELVTLMAVTQVPEDWVRQYPPPYPGSPYGLYTHRQDLRAPSDAWTYVSNWVRIDLAKGRVTPLTNAPASERAGWWEVYERKATWSDDGSAIVLPGSFQFSNSRSEVRPCVLAVDAKRLKSECIRPLKRQLVSGHEAGWESIDEIRFARGQSDQVVMTHFDHDGGGKVARVYRRIASGEWNESNNGPITSQRDGVSTMVEESYKRPPVLVATNPNTSKSITILDPNPQLRSVQSGQAELYKWKDSTGRDWQALLYKPLNYRSTIRYPLVIQTHGYNLERYVPSGSFASAFVAQELASAGIMVVQMRACAEATAALEATCNVQGFESVVKALADDGTIDPNRVGIIGFSRTVYHVLAALARSTIHFRAASITDGVTFGYWNFLESVRPEKSLLNEELAIYGAMPIGEGLSNWVRDSPTFNLDEVTTPIRVVAMRGRGVVDMWEPYALLEAMHKSVELIVLNTDQHVVVDPRVRLAAQEGNVDWLRFWLQGYVDPDPRKKQEYERWEMYPEVSTPMKPTAGSSTIVR